MCVCACVWQCRVICGGPKRRISFHPTDLFRTRRAQQSDVYYLETRSHHYNNNNSNNNQNNNCIYYNSILIL